MAFVHGHFTGARVSGGYTLDWYGTEVWQDVAEATRRGINKVNAAAVAIAKAHPTWENHTGQTEDAVFLRPAQFEVAPYGMYVKGPHVWGEWGIENRPRYKVAQGDQGSIFFPSDRYRQMLIDQEGTDERARPKLLTTVDVALFLEFGTHASELRHFTVEPRPWIYPAWDATKHTLAAVIKTEFDLIAAMSPKARGSIRDPLGRFAAQAGLS